MEIPKEHNAMVYENPGTLSVKMARVPTPEPGPGQVLVRLSHTGVCHSDYAIMMHHWREFPLVQSGHVGGHEGIGQVVKLGPAVAELSGVHVGDRVGIKWLSGACLRCSACMTGWEGSCPGQIISGCMVPGTFQEYTLAPANYLTPIPDDVPADLAAPMLCGGLTVYSGLQKAGARGGDWVVVAGAGGGLGHLAVQIGCAGMGLRMLGIDSSAKEALVRGCGAEDFVAVDKFPRGPDGDSAVAGEVMRITQGGAASVLVCTNSAAAYAQAPSFVRFRGSVVCIGLTEGTNAPIQTASPNFIISRQCVITGSAVGNRHEAISCQDLLARGLVKPHVETFKPKDLGTIFADLHAGKLLGRAVLTLDSASWH